MADDFDGNHQGGEPQDGSEKMLEVLDPVGLDPVKMGRKEYHQGTGYGGIQIVRGGRNPGTRPSRLEKRMKNPRVPIKGRNSPPGARGCHPKISKPSR